MKKETPRIWHKGPPAAQGAAASRVWNSGPPPHVGWWNASIAQDENAWRWWDGVQWSDWAGPSYTAEDARAAVLRLDYEGGIEWTDYYPEGARVPRVDPAAPRIAGLLPLMNTGNKYAWELAAAGREPAPLALDELRAASKPYAPLSMQLPEACSFGDGMVVAYDTSAKPTPEEDEAWRAISTGQRTGTPVPQNPEPRDLAGVSTRDLMTELFRRVG